MNWEKLEETQAFCVYDLPPILPHGSLIFLHAIKTNRLAAYARYVGYEHIKGWYRRTVDHDETLWISERERIWHTFGPSKLHTHDKNEFDRFWKAQMGVRGLFLMEDLQELLETISWNNSMQILQVFRPLGFSYRYLTSTQVQKFLELADIKMEVKIEGITSPEVIWRS